MGRCVVHFLRCDWGAIFSLALAIGANVRKRSQHSLCAERMAWRSSGGWLRAPEFDGGTAGFIGFVVDGMRSCGRLNMSILWMRLSGNSFFR